MKVKCPYWEDCIQRKNNHAFKCYGEFDYNGFLAYKSCYDYWIFQEQLISELQGQILSMNGIIKSMTEGSTLIQADNKRLEEELKDAEENLAERNGDFDNAAKEVSKLHEEINKLKSSKRTRIGPTYK